MDLSAVPQLDSIGIRVLVRAHSTALRFNGSFRLVRPSAPIVLVLQIAKLTNVLSIYESVETATQPLA